MNRTESEGNNQYKYRESNKARMQQARIGKMPESELNDIAEESYRQITAGEQAQQSHCDHECVCDDFHPEYDPDYQEICNNSDCPNDTRKHTSASQQRIDQVQMITDIVNSKEVVNAPNDLRIPCQQKLESAIWYLKKIALLQQAGDDK